ncbi:MAG: PD-(D/E)XK nuclease domain-containing protein [Spirochaetaceae bacterium]|nr:PD-(D/E)XK nuclease domain-containing protein [Spirochaetaceae bacterium]
MAVRTGDHTYLFEFKVAETSPPGSALTQLQERDYAAKYRADGHPIHLIGVEFSAKPATSPPSTPTTPDGRPPLEARRGRSWSSRRRARPRAKCNRCWRRWIGGWRSQTTGCARSEAGAGS